MKIAVAIDKVPWEKIDQNKNLMDQSLYANMSVQNDKKGIDSIDSKRCISSDSQVKEGN